jgi:DNA-binding protein HU-beta/integration host factor subunit alpha
MTPPHFSAAVYTRVGRNPNKPEIDVPIPARAMVKFKAGKEMKAEVLKLTPKSRK